MRRSVRHSGCLFEFVRQSGNLQGLFRDADGLCEDHGHLVFELEDLADALFIVHAEGNGAESLRCGIEIHVLRGFAHMDGGELDVVRELGGVAGVDEDACGIVRKVLARDELSAV